MGFTHSPDVAFGVRRKSSGGIMQFAKSETRTGVTLTDSQTGFARSAILTGRDA
jgi:hypothetical protein